MHCCWGNQSGQHFTHQTCTDFLLRLMTLYWLSTDSLITFYWLLLTLFRIIWEFCPTLAWFSDITYTKVLFISEVCSISLLFSMRLNFISQSKMDKLTLHWACLLVLLYFQFHVVRNWMRFSLWQNKFCRTFFSPYLLTQGKRIWCIRFSTEFEWLQCRLSNFQVFSPEIQWLATFSLQNSSFLSVLE